MIQALFIAMLAAPGVKWSTPKLYVEGQPFPAHVEIQLHDGENALAWMLEPAAFTIDGQPLQERKHKDPVPFNATRTFDVDLGPAIASSKAFKKAGFKLDYAPFGDSGKPIDVRFGVAAEKGVNFMDAKKVPVADLASYHVILRTVRGDMEVEMWPDVAPNHVRNFLDLSHSGFYEGTAFHRVAPCFMIQGGDPNTKDEKKRAQWGSGGGPRMVKHEFSAKKHERGVLSMARGGGSTPAEDEKFWDSASSQFFVMDAEYPSLDGKYSAFGRLVDGFDALDKIVNAPGTVSPDGTITPAEPQRILKTLVVHIAPEKK